MYRIRHLYSLYSVLAHYELDIQNIQGQDYDGASNMRGEYYELRALILKDCKYAYYIHCFAHRLQLALMAASKNVISIHQFFNKLNNIVNTIGVSCKLSDELKEAHADDIAHLISIDELETGRGQHQETTIPRPCEIRWSSHLRSLKSLLNMFSAACTVLLNVMDGVLPKEWASAKTVYEDMTCFEFVFILYLMIEIMGITDMLCQTLQCKSQDIVNAVRLVSSTKHCLQKLREQKWDYLLTKMKLFCEGRNIEVPDLNARYIDKRGRARHQNDIFTVEHHYRVDFFYAAIDAQLQEISGRFSEDAMELLVLSMVLNPRNTLGSFKIIDICQLVQKLYLKYFTSYERDELKRQFEHYEYDVVGHPDYKDLSTMSDLYQWLVKTKRLSVLYNLVFRIVVLVLTFSVSTATTEISSKLVFGYIERQIAKNKSVKAIIDGFESRKRRRVRFS